MIQYECSQCGVAFGMTPTYADSLKHMGNKFYCLNGHIQSFGETIPDKLRRELQRAQQQIARAEDEAREAQQRAEVETRKRVRLEKRANAGVCPCCTRTFQNVARHMKTKHPNITPIKATA